MNKVVQKKAVCPTSNTHNLFLTIVLITEEWLVDSRGKWKETSKCLSDTLKHDSVNVWRCAECGKEAKFENE